MDRPVARRKTVRFDRVRAARFRPAGVFLALAALYESWSIPVSVLLVVPLGVLGALLAGTVCAAVRTTCTSRSA